MQKSENIFLGFIALFSALYMLFSAQMDMGTVIKPGPGFVPVALGGIGLLSSLIMLVSNLKKAEKESTDKIGREGKLRFLGYLIAAVVFIPMLQFLGAAIAIFVLIIALTKISGAKGWIYPILFSAVFTAASYVLFEIILHVSLPKGIIDLI